MTLSVAWTMQPASVDFMKATGTQGANKNKKKKGKQVKAVEVVPVEQTVDQGLNEAVQAVKE